MQCAAGCARACSAVPARRSAHSFEVEHLPSALPVAPRLLRQSPREGDRHVQHPKLRAAFRGVRPGRRADAARRRGPRGRHGALHRSRSAERAARDRQLGLDERGRVASGLRPGRRPDVQLLEREHDVLPGEETATATRRARGNNRRLPGPATTRSRARPDVSAPRATSSSTRRWTPTATTPAGRASISTGTTAPRRARTSRRSPRPPTARPRPASGARTYPLYRRSRVTAAKNILRDVICQVNALGKVRFGLAQFRISRGRARWQQPRRERRLRAGPDQRLQDLDGRAERLHAEHRHAEPRRPPRRRHRHPRGRDQHAARRDAVPGLHVLPRAGTPRRSRRARTLRRGRTFPKYSYRPRESAVSAATTAPRARRPCPTARSSTSARRTSSSSSRTASRRRTTSTRRDSDRQHRAGLRQLHDPDR